MTRLIIFFALLCTALIYSAGVSADDIWKKTSSCSAQSVGKADAASSPEDSIFAYTIENWKPTTKYVYHGELSWDPNLINTQGRIILKKKGTSLEQRIADWSNPPINAEIEQDITRYVDGNGTYIIEWQYMGGRSGVCIMRSEITTSD